METALEKTPAGAFTFGVSYNGIGPISLAVETLFLFNWTNEIATLSPIDSVSYGPLILGHASGLCRQRHLES